MAPQKIGVEDQSANPAMVTIAPNLEKQKAGKSVNSFAIGSLPRSHAGKAKTKNGSRITTAKTCCTRTLNYRKS